MTSPLPAPPEQALPDLRAAVLGVMAWAGGLGGFLLPPWVTSAAMAVGALGLLVRWRRGRPVVVVLAWLVAAAAVAGSAMLRVEGVAASRLAGLAQERAYVTAVVRVTSDPVLKQGRFASFTLTRASTVEVTGRGGTTQGHVPVLSWPTSGGSMWSSDRWSGWRDGRPRRTVRTSPQ